jgi:DNA polymerase sigma
MNHLFSCRNVVKDFSSKIPMIFFTVDGLRCELSLNNNHAFQTSRLLRDYIAVDPRVKTLAVAIRFWARLCLIDRQAEGTLPAHAFDLLLVFFMQQQTKPVLPCIHEYLEDRDAEVYESKCTSFFVLLHLGYNFRSHQLPSQN